MKSPPSLGLRTKNIAPFVGLIFYQSTCPEFRYEDGKLLGTQPHLTRRSASTHYVPNINLNLIKAYLTFILTHIHTNMH